MLLSEILLFVSPAFAVKPVVVSVASSATSGAGTDGFEACASGFYNTNRAESTIAVDPSNPSHLIGLSKFFFSSLSGGSLTDWSQVYRFHLGAYESFTGGTAIANDLLPGYDCVTGPAAGLPGWDATTDPNIAFGFNATTGKEDAYTNVLGFNYNNFANAIEVSKKPAGEGWLTPVIVMQFTGEGVGRSYDKQWIAADYNPPCTGSPTPVCSPFSGNVYVAWTIFGLTTGKLYFSRSTDGGLTFSPPSQVSQFTGPHNTFVYLDVDTAGTLYLEYTDFGKFFATSGTAVVRVSTDGGRSFGDALLGPSFNSIPFGVSVGTGNPTNWGFTLPKTTFRDGIVDYFAASHTHPGNLYIVAEQWDKQGGSGNPSTGNGDYDVAVYRSTNGGNSWTTLGFANDPSTVGDTTDQFQPEVATDTAGNVAVAFYDRRNPCPTAQPAPNYFTKPGESNYCIQTAIQWYDDASGSKVGSNIILGKSWDPQEPSAASASDLPHSVFDPCNNVAFGLTFTVCVTFIGDYFGLAVSGGKAYILDASTFPSFQYSSGVSSWSQASSGISPSSIEGAANGYYQQQVLFVVTA